MSFQIAVTKKENYVYCLNISISILIKYSLKTDIKPWFEVKKLINYESYLVLTCLWVRLKLYLMGFFSALRMTKAEDEIKTLPTLYIWFSYW